MNISIDTIREMVSVWAASYPEIVQIILFGSRAQGDSKPNSDLVLAFIVEGWDGESGYPRYFFGKGKWKKESEAILGYPICVVRQSDNVKQEIQENIERDGIVTYERLLAKQGFSMDRGPCSR